MPDDMCQTTEWTGWSECSTTCGKGYELRTRRFLNRMGRKKCPHVDTTERRSCAGTEATCPGGDRPEAETRVLANPDCAVTSWSDWSPCSVSCGKPEIYRLRPWRSRLVPHTTYSTNNMGQKREGVAQPIQPISTQLDRIGCAIYQASPKQHPGFFFSFSFHYNFF